MFRKSPRLLLVIILLFTASLACQAVSNAGNQVQEVQNTAQAAAEQIQELATQAPEIMQTVQVLATQAPELLDTAQAFATENPGIEQTAIAVATEGFSMGEAPADIPVVDRTTVTNFFGSADVVSYSTTLDFQSVVSFYKTEMPNNGWSADPSTTFEQGETVILTYTKPDSTATLTVTVNPSDQSTIVAIVIQAK